jgi:hypothetical protein
MAGGSTLSDEQNGGFGAGPRYCRVTFDADQVRRRWKATRPTDAKILKFMIEVGTTFLAERKAVMKSETFVDLARERTGCTHKAARAAFAKLPEYLREPGKGGRPPGASKGK